MTLLDASVMTFDQPIAWNWLVQFCILATALLFGNVLRTKIPFLRKSLIPSALIGGLLLLIFKAIPGCKELINKPVMEIVTYHALGLGFVALALKNNKIESKSTPMKVIETGALTASTYVIQGIVGLIVSILFFYLGGKLFYAAGLLLPMGYGQGPGQALNFGKIFTTWANKQGIPFSGADFGLSIAATGFIVGSVVGVIYMNILRRKGVLSRKKLAEAQVNKLEDYEGKGEIPDAESIDKLSVQICMVLFVYFLVFLFTNWIQGMDLGNFGTNTLKPMLWGFNFLTGTLFGIADEPRVHQQLYAQPHQRFLFRCHDCCGYCCYQLREFWIVHLALHHYLHFGSGGHLYLCVNHFKAPLSQLQIRGILLDVRYADGHGQQWHDSAA